MTIFNQTKVLLSDTGGKVARQEARRLVRWAWTHLYQSSVSHGIVLPGQFYTDLTTMLSSHDMIPQLVETLLYTSLLPCLKPPLRSLADVLKCPSSSLTNPHSNAVFTAQVLF